jgi:predicted acylesterase/phospholipase RssA
LIDDFSVSTEQIYPSQKISVNRSKTALVLAGGGITGAVYEIGALRAIDDMLVDYTVNDFDIYVGTSAGALIGSFVANGLTPNEIMQGLDDRHPEIHGLRVGDIFQTNVGGMFRRATKLPGALLDIVRNTLFNFGDVAASDMAWELARALPNGLYNAKGLERYVHNVLSEPGRTNRFDRLDRELYIVATELETGQRAVFGQGGKSIVPISQAVAASSAVPLIYRPVQIFDRDYLDGGLHGSASIDLAIEAGAKLVVCVNPMVPLNTSAMEDNHYIRDRGVQAILNQTVRTFLHAGVRYHIKNLRAKYPDVDIILIEPHWDDFQMFSYSPMYYGSRLTVAEHGFESVTVGMLTHYDYFYNVLMRHNIRLTKDLVSIELSELRDSGNDLEVVQQIIERDWRNPVMPGARIDVDVDHHHFG